VKIFSMISALIFFISFHIIVNDANDARYDREYRLMRSICVDYPQSLAIIKINVYFVMSKSVKNHFHVDILIRFFAMDTNNYPKAD